MKRPHIRLLNGGDLLRRCLVWAAFTAVLSLPLLALHAQDAQPAAATATNGLAADAAMPGDASAEAVEEEIVTTEQIEFFEYLQRGGTTMIFLGLLSVVAVTFTIERLFNLKRGVINPAGLLEQSKALWKQEKYEQIIALCEKTPSILATIITAFVHHRDSSALELSNLAGDIASRNIRTHMQRAYPIAVVATLAPLLGLLGTVIGMIESFEMVAIAGSMGDASVLAGGISKALVTTATGLIIAVPTLGLYHYFRSRTLNHATALEEDVNELQTEWFMRKATLSAAAPGGME